jgi:hypothetical protein
LGAKSPETVAQQAPKKAHFVCKEEAEEEQIVSSLFWGTSYGTIYTEFQQ